MERMEPTPALSLPASRIRISTSPHRMSSAATMRTGRSGSFSTTTAMTAPNSTLVSRKAATMAIGATRHRPQHDAVGHELQGAADQPAPPVRLHRRDQAAAVAVERIGHQHERVADEHPRSYRPPDCRTGARRCRPPPNRRRWSARSAAQSRPRGGRNGRARGRRAPTAGIRRRPAPRCRPSRARSGARRRRRRGAVAVISGAAPRAIG